MTSPVIESTSEGRRVDRSFSTGSIDEAGATVFCVIATIALLLSVAALLLGVTTVAPVVAVSLFGLIVSGTAVALTTRALYVSDEEIGFRRVGGRTQWFNKNQVYVRTCLLRYGRGARFHVRGSWQRFTYPFEFTNANDTGEPLTLETLKQLGVDVET